jgi:hypothetical protein
MADTAKEEALAQLKEEKDRAAMGKAYDEAARRSMGTFKDKDKTPKPPAAASAASAASSPNKKAKGGCVKMAKGGSVSSRADGVAQRGKTKGRMV